MQAEQLARTAQAAFDADLELVAQGRDEKPGHCWPLSETALRALLDMQCESYERMMEDSIRKIGEHKKTLDQIYQKDLGTWKKLLAKGVRKGG